MKTVYLVFGIVAFATIVVGYWLMFPGANESRFGHVRLGMSEVEVEKIMGPEGHWAEKRYMIEGNEWSSQKVWQAKERLRDIEVVVVFGDDSIAIAKQIYKSWSVLNWFGG